MSDFLNRKERKGREGREERGYLLVSIIFWEYSECRSIYSKVNDSVAFSPDGKQLASGGADKKITIWPINL